LSGFFLQYRQHVIKSYPALFIETEVEEDLLETPTDNENPFGWYSTIIALAGEDILKTEAVVKKHHLEVFNYLTYMTHINNKRERALKRQMK